MPLNRSCKARSRPETELLVPDPLELKTDSALSSQHRARPTAANSVC